MLLVHKEGTDTSLYLVSANQRPVLCQHRPIRSLTVDLWSGCGQQTVRLFPPDNSCCCCFILFQIQKLFWDKFQRLDLDKKRFAGLRKIWNEIWVLNYVLCLWKNYSSLSLKYINHIFSDRIFIFTFIMKSWLQYKRGRYIFPLNCKFNSWRELCVS